MLRRVVVLFALGMCLAGCPGPIRGVNDVRTLATQVTFGSSVTEVMEAGGPPDSRYFNPGGLEETWEYWDQAGNGDKLLLTLRDNRVTDIRIEEGEAPN